MITEQTRFTLHGLTCLVQRDLPYGPHCTTDQTYRVTVDGVHVGTTGRESDAFRYARHSANRLAVALACRSALLSLPAAVA